jgi:hypothetical protein
MVPSVTVHVLRDRGLAHHDSDFPELTVDRGAPQRGFVSDIVRISVRMSAGVLGRPVRRRLFHVQNRRNPRRYHATTVAGFTRTSDARQPVHVRENHTQSRRSAAVRRTRGRRDRLRTWSWCLSARTSRCSAARDRMSERSDRSTATKAGITDRRRCDRAENLNDPDVRHFW